MLLLDLLPIRDIDVISPNFGPFDTASNFGMTRVIKRVPISSPYGYLVISNSTFELADWRECGGQIIKTISFRIVDATNRLIDLEYRIISLSRSFDIRLKVVVVVDEA